MHLLHRKISQQELVLVDYDEDVADSKLSHSFGLAILPVEVCTASKGSMNK